MKPVEIRSEHEWLQQMVGEWTTEASATGPDGVEHNMSGTESVRSLGGGWIVGEWTSPEPDGTTARSLITLGFDSDRGRFVGSFISSMMTHLWIYEGQLSEDGRTLVLDTTGPGPSGGIAPYQDRFEILDRDHRVLSSYARQEDGSWQPFMKMTSRRTG